MVHLTVELLRRRAEHNEGCLSTLKEITLHQQDLEEIGILGDICRELEIIYLCNNYIPRIEGLIHLKNLKYLNLAINNIRVIEGLEGCESLEKLDLTLNFIADVTSLERLRANPQLDSLHMTGNPCTHTPGYRAFVVHALPQLRELDGEEVVRSERIVARQEESETGRTVDEVALRVHEENRLKEEMVSKGIDPFPPKFNDKGERVYGHSAEERVQMLRETEEKEQQRKNPPKDPNSITALAESLNKKPEKLTPEQEIEKYGRILQRNEAKIPYNLDEQPDVIILTVEPGKFISTTLISVRAEPTWIRVEVKGKVLQLSLPEEIASSKVTVQRATTTGQLKITMPLADQVLNERRARKERYAVAAMIASDSKPDPPTVAADTKPPKKNEFLP